MPKLSAYLAGLRTSELRLRYAVSDQDGSARAALKRARQAQRAVYVYQGNRYMCVAYRVTFDLQEAQCGINNTCRWVIKIEPDGTATRYTLDTVPARC